MTMIKPISMTPITLLGYSITGTAGNDVLTDLQNGVDYATNDTVSGLGGNDLITLYKGNDIAYGGDGNDIMYDFGNGNDAMHGDAGNDSFFVGLGNDTVDGGAGTDSVSYLFSAQIAGVDLQAGYAISEGIDTLISIENAYGSAGNDSLLGSAAANEMRGYDGNDYIDGRGGNDLLDGQYGNDKLVGGAGNDSLYGYFGNDTMDGGADNDVLWGFWGDDVMTGGSGADRFYFGSTGDFDHFDTIKDFQHGIDKIDVSAIDARPDVAGNQAFTFDSTPDGAAEEFFDGLSDDWNGIISSDPGPYINGDTGEIEYRYDGNYTYVYLSYGDGLTDVSIRLDGHITLSASDFNL